ncbi:hypothetical protein ACFL04_02655 [Patescibacteria group bacterium]
MTRENYEGTAHADLPRNTELEKLERDNAVSRVLVQLEELGVQKDWEDAPGGIEKGELKDQLRQLEIGQHIDGMLSDGTRWQVKRLGAIEYDVTTAKE